MTHLGPGELYRPPHAGKLPGAVGRQANHTQAMLVAAVAASLAIVCAAAAVMTALLS
jgi:hypothetical protein